MINSSGTESKYGLLINLDGTTGIKDLPEGRSCFAETQMRVEIVGVGLTNVTFIQGRIHNSTSWDEIATITGQFNGVMDISTYDYIRYIILVADGIGEIISSGFFLS